MIKRFIHRITRWFANRTTTTPGNPGLNGISNLTGNAVRNTGSSMNEPYSQHNRFHRPLNGELNHRKSDTGYHHSASRLLRDGHLRVAIQGFNDTAFDVSLMSRHDCPALAQAVADLPCKIKMVSRRNIAAALRSAISILDDAHPGRRGIVLITSGDDSVGQAQLQQLAEKAARKRIGIHLVCLGAKDDDATCGPRINTKNSLGYGSFRMVQSQQELLSAIRDAFDGLAPAFGMRGTNKGMILVDCSETMVELYRNTTRIEMIVVTLNEFLKNPLIRRYPFERPPNGASTSATSDCRTPGRAQRRESSVLSTTSLPRKAATFHSNEVEAQVE